MHDGQTWTLNNTTKCMDSCYWIYEKTYLFFFNNVYIGGLTLSSQSECVTCLFLCMRHLGVGDANDAVWSDLEYVQYL